MQRDFDLIRKILLEVQSTPPGNIIRLGYPGEYDQAVVDEHVRLLEEAGLLLCTSTARHVRGLTWKGHDFIESAAKDTIWQKAKTTVQERGGALTFEVLTELLKRLVSDAVGLP